jgi:hypothetical protein
LIKIGSVCQPALEVLESSSWGERWAAGYLRNNPRFEVVARIDNEPSKPAAGDLRRRIPMACGYVYLGLAPDWFNRRVHLQWTGISDTWLEV